jgi:beta-N-acetylhexosaminidase
VSAAAAPARSTGAKPTDPSPDELGQRVMTATSGTKPSRSLLRRVRRGRVGGVILFSSNIASPGQAHDVITVLQRAARRGKNPPLLVAADQEGGTVKRFSSLPPCCAAARMGSSIALARREGRRTGRALRRIGVDVDLAPVTDVPRLSRHFLGSRAFSRSRPRASRTASAFARGLQAAGVAATAKHFPGLGYARMNTDFAQVTIRARRRALRADYAPFAAAVDAGAELVMLSNAAYPALDGTRRPAAMSRQIVASELRGIVGFEGVTISDSLATPAIQRVRDPYPKVANAGTDILLFASERQSARGYAALLAAARAGRLDRAQALAATGRIRALKAALARGGLGVGRKSGR